MRGTAQIVILLLVPVLCRAQEITIADAKKDLSAAKEELEEVDCKGCKAGLRDGNPNCKVRPCAIEKGVVTCAECGEFSCETIRKQMDAIKPIAEKHRDSMPAEDVQRYIAPYESEKRLRRLRSE